MGLVRRRRTGVLARHRIVHLRRRASALRLHTGRVHRRVLSCRFDQRQQRLVGIIHLGLQQSLRRGSAVLGRLCRVEGRLQRLWPTQLWIDRMRVRLLLLLWLAECRRRLAILGRSKDGLVAVGQGANSLAVAIFNPLVEPAHAAATTQARQDLGGGGSLATRGGEEAFLGGLACSLQCARGEEGPWILACTGRTEGRGELQPSRDRSGPFSGDRECTCTSIRVGNSREERSTDAWYVRLWAGCAGRATASKQARNGQYAPCLQHEESCISCVPVWVATGEPWLCSDDDDDGWVGECGGGGGGASGLLLCAAVYDIGDRALAGWRDRAICSRRFSLR